MLERRISAGAVEPVIGAAGVDAQRQVAAERAAEPQAAWQC